MSLTKYEQKCIKVDALNKVRRERTRLGYLDNPNIESWEWVAAKSTRTCITCLMMDGMQFSVDTPFEEVRRCTNLHCRCTMIAVINGWEQPPRVRGAEWFATLSAEEQRMITAGE